MVGSLNVLVLKGKCHEIVNLVRYVYSILILLYVCIYTLIMQQL